MCWPNLSVLKMGLRTALELSESFDALAFAEGSWALENRSEVARGIAGGARSCRKETKTWLICFLLGPILFLH